MLRRMTPRVTAPLLAAPLAAVAVGGGLAAARALATTTGVRSAGHSVSTLVLLVAAALVLSAASGRAASTERPLRTVALASVVLALWLLSLEWLLPAYADVIASVGGPPLRGFADAAVQLPWLLALAFALPYLVRAAVTSTPQAPVGAGWVFGATAAGAALAFLLSGDLAQQHGVAGLWRAAGLASLGIALVLLLLDRPLAHGSAPPPGTQLGVVEDGQNPSPAAFALGFVLGGAAMAWALLLRPLAGGPLAALDLVGALILGGLAVGALLGGWLARRMPRPDLRLLLGLALTGYLVLLSLPLLGRLPLALLEAGRDPAARDAALERGALLALGPAGILAGITLLLGVRVRSDWTGAAASSAGLLLTWATAGVVAGSGIARLVLLPRAAPALALLAAAGVAVVTAAALRLRARHAPRALFALLTILPLGALLWPDVHASWRGAEPTPTRTRAAMTPLPVAIEADDAEDLDLVAAFFSGRERAERALGGPLPPAPAFDGPLALLAEPGGSLRIQQAGRLLGILGTETDAAGARAEVALGLVPAVLHPHPGRALVLGPGSGLAVEALLGARVARVHVAAPVPAAIDLARAYRAEGVRLADDPRVTRHIATARGLLPRPGAAPASGASRYDVVVAGLPLDPALFTEEGIAGVRAVLAPDGIAAFHLPFEGLDADALRRVLATLRTRFETVWLFRFRGHLLAVCAASIDLGAGRFGAVLGDGPGRADPTAAAGLATRVGLGSRGRVLGHLVLDTTGVDRILPIDGPTLTDDRPWLARRMEANLRGARDARAELGGVIDVGFPPRLAELVPDARRRDAWMAAIVEGWLEEDPFVADVWDREVRYGVTAAGWRARARAAAARGEPDQAVRFLDLAIADARDPAPLVAEKIDTLAAGVLDGRLAGGDAREEVLRLGSAYPRNGIVLAAVGRARHRFGDLGGARTALEAALRQTTPPPPEGTALLLARVLLAVSDPDEARIRGLMESDPALYEDPDALDLYLGLLSPQEHAKRAADLELAMQTLRREEAARLTAQARAHIARGAFEAAEQDALRVTDLVPERASAFELLGVAQLGRSALAADEAIQARSRQAALNAFARAIDVSQAPETSKRRARRLAGWFGLSIEIREKDDEAR